MHDSYFQARIFSHICYAAYLWLLPQTRQKTAQTVLPKSGYARRYIKNYPTARKHLSFIMSQLLNMALEPECCSALPLLVNLSLYTLQSMCMIIQLICIIFKCLCITFYYYAYYPISWILLHNFTAYFNLYALSFCL